MTDTNDHRDATEAELVTEPDAVIEVLAAGGLNATSATVELAKAELERRRFQAYPMSAWKRTRLEQVGEERSRLFDTRRDADAELAKRNTEQAAATALRVDREIEALQIEEEMIWADAIMERASSLIHDGMGQGAAWRQARAEREGRRRI